MKKQRSEYLYISRDKIAKLDPLFYEYNLSDCKMKIDREGTWEPYDECYCSKEFEQLTGLTLKPGKQARINKGKLRELLEEIK